MARSITAPPGGGATIHISPYPFVPTRYRLLEPQLPTSGRLSTDGDLCRVTPEEMNVFLDPLQSEAHVVDPRVRCPEVRQLGRGQVSKRPEAILNDYSDVRILIGLNLLAQIVVPDRAKTISPAI